MRNNEKSIGKKYFKNTKTISNALFWDVNHETIDINIHQQFIIERILNFGTIENFKELLEIYGTQKIISNIFKIKKLSAKTINFVSFYFTVPKDKLICYTKKQSKNQLWSY